MPARAFSTVQIVDPDKGTLEGKSITCCHCNGLVFVAVRGLPENLGTCCRMCMKLQCKRCENLDACTPFEKKLEAMERTDRLRRHAAGEWG